MEIKPNRKDAFNLFLEGTIALAEVERIGIRLDVSYLKGKDKEVGEQVAETEKRLWKMDEGKAWRQRYGAEANFDSPDQIVGILYDKLGYTPIKHTKNQNISVDDEVLRKIGSSFTTAILSRRKLLKVKNTFISQLLLYQRNDIIHPNFNLNLVQTYRSSSDSPNFQNNPVRDPIQGPMIRRGIIPHNIDDIIAEVDFSGIEVRVSACYHHDPAMIRYIEDPTKDMHRDMAAKCFLLKQKEIGKKIRYCGKNGFVFPAFYGSYYKQIAPRLWEMVDEFKLITESGLSVRKHLNRCGLKNIKQFVRHIQKVEEEFWGVKFKVYAQWKKDWYKTYLREGEFDLLTGFRCSGPMKRTEACNYPVQGSAFHCTLWALIKISKWLKENNMKSRIIGQIHDSIIFNLNAKEKDVVLSMARRIMCVEIRKHWPWIIVPLDVEAEVAPAGKSWADKVKYEIKEVA